MVTFETQQSTRAGSNSRANPFSGKHTARKVLKICPMLSGGGAGTHRGSQGTMREKRGLAEIAEAGISVAILVYPRDCGQHGR